MDYKVSSSIVIMLLIIKLSSSKTLIQNGRPRLPVKKPPTKLTQRQNGICANAAVGEFVANPEDCKLFYMCSNNGEAIMAVCPSTMLFNSESKLCDLPSNVRCSTGIKDDLQNNDAEPPGTANTDSAGASRYCSTILPQQDLDRITVIGSANSCQQYYICYYGQALLQECSANLHWNAVTEKCDLPSIAGCRLSSGGNGGAQNNGVGTQNNNGVGTQNNNGVGTQNNNGGGTQNNENDLINCPTYGQHIFPHMERCDYFIYCVKGHAVLQQCQFYYHFDIVSKSCKWRTAAMCVRDLNINFKSLSRTKIIRE